MTRGLPLRVIFFGVMGLFQRAVQHLIVIPWFGGVEGLAAEEGKVRLVEVGHGKFPCAQGLILEFQLAVGGVVAVFAVAQNGQPMLAMWARI